MNKNKLKLLRESENGSGLVLSLMVLLVLSVLGTSLGMITINSYKLSDVNRDSSSAYYIAEAGANLAYEQIKSDVTNIYKDNQILENTTFFNKIDQTLKINDSNYATYNDEFNSQLNNKPKATIKIEKISNGENKKEYKIISSGEVDNRSKIVEKNIIVEWPGKTVSNGLTPFPEQASVIAKNDVNLLNGYIYKNLYLDSNKKGLLTISNSGSVGYDQVFTSYQGNKNDVLNYTGNSDDKKKTYQNKIKPMNIAINWSEYNKIANSFPNVDLINYGVAKPDFVTTINEQILNLNDKQYFKKIQIESNRIVNINTGGKHVNILVDELLVDNGEINILDNGSVTFYVKNRFTINSSSRLNKNGKPNQLNVYYDQEATQTLIINGNERINANIFLKKGAINIGGSAMVKGTLVFLSGDINLSGNSKNELVIIAPNSKLIVSGSARNDGTAVVDKVELEGSAVLDYKKNDLSKFPLGSSQTIVNVENIEDFIDTTPAIEN